MAMGVDRSAESQEAEGQELEAQDWETFFNTAYGASGRADAIPRDDEGNVDPRDERMDRMEMQMSMQNLQRTFEKRFPNATEAQIQQFLMSEVESDVNAKFDSIVNAYRTTQEEEERGDGPRSLNMEDGSAEGGGGSEDEAFSMEDAARRAAGLEDSDLY